MARPAQARRYLGPEDASQDVLQFCAQTAAAAAAAGPAAQHGVPLLPPGLLVDGLPAAILSRCQARLCSTSQQGIGPARNAVTICETPCRDFTGQSTSFTGGVQAMPQTAQRRPSDARRACAGLITSRRGPAARRCAARRRRWSRPSRRPRCRTAPCCAAWRPPQRLCCAA